jgi:hypothetical protein
MFIRLTAKTCCVLLCVFTWCGRCYALDAYHVGNSFTWAINPDLIASWAASRATNYNYGYHIANGKNPRTMWENPNWVDFTVAPYGKYSNALPNYDWDVVTFEPFDVWDPWASDAQVIGQFINFMKSNPGNTSTQVYIYESWPFSDRIGSDTTYSQFWDQPWNGSGYSWTIQTRDYFQKLTDQLNGTALGLDKDVLIAPVGDVMYALDQRMRAGDVAGFDSVLEVYADTLHLTPDVGYFIGGTVFYATMFGENPMGLPVPSWIQPYVTPEVAAIIQRVAWDVVAGHPYSGVAAEVVGDFNGDSNVDAADFSLWKSTYGSKVDLRADANLDFVVDTADYTIWRNQFDTLVAGGAASATVPEPGTLLLIGAACFVGGLRRGRRHGR